MSSDHQTSLYSIPNSTYDFFTFHETSDFMILLIKRRGLEKNIVYLNVVVVLTQYFFQSSTHAHFWQNKRPQKVINIQTIVLRFRIKKNVVVLIPTTVLNQKKVFKQIFDFWDQITIKLFKKNLHWLVFNFVSCLFSFLDGDSCVNLMTKSSVPIIHCKQ